MEKKIGDYSFIAGVILAIVLGLATTKLGAAESWLWSLLVMLGIVVGLLNVSGRETKEFLWVTVALVLVAYAGSSQVNSWEKVELIGKFLKQIFNSILAFVVPASIVVALKEVWILAKSSSE